MGQTNAQQISQISAKNLQKVCKRCLLADNGEQSGWEFSMGMVLVVDDSALAREMLMGELRRAGFEVETAIDGVDAKAKILANPPILVVTDLIMPNVNGYELCRWIKVNPSTLKVPVIMCSTKGEEFDRYWGMKQGADAYLTKPYQAKDMINAVKYLLEEAGYYQEDTMGF